MQSNFVPERLDAMRDFVQDTAGIKDLGGMWCTVGEEYIRYGASHCIGNEEDFGLNPTIVPKDVREDYAIKFIEWSFDDTVTRVSIEIRYDEIELEVSFVGGEKQTFSQEFRHDEEDDEREIAVHTIRVRKA
jgi:hypothetical protein